MACENLPILDEFKSTILDIAKTIKSNDATFKIDTVPKFGDKFIALMGKYVDTAREISATQKAYSKLLEKVEDDEENEEFADFDTYKELFHQTIEAEKENAPTDRKAIADIKKIINPHTDEEILVEAPTRQIPKDPITKKDIKFAVKSTVCGHIYDKDGIEDYFLQKERNSKTRIQCPQAGCTNKNMKRDELIHDEETNRMIQSL